MLKQPTKQLKRPSNLIEWFNRFMNFNNSKIELVVAREGELPNAYFQDGLYELSCPLLDKIKTLKDIEDNLEQLLLIEYWLRDGYSGLKASGKY